MLIFLILDIRLNAWLELCKKKTPFFILHIWFLVIYACDIDLIFPKSSTSFWLQLSSPTKFLMFFTWFIYFAIIVGIYKTDYVNCEVKELKMILYCIPVWRTVRTQYIVGEILTFCDCLDNTIDKTFNFFFSSVLL